MSTTTHSLPADFADLAPFSAWILETENERYDRRIASSMDEMQALYDAGLPRMKAGMAYCDQFPIDALPDDAKNLMNLFFSVIEISFPIECWRQARVPDSGAAEINCVHQPRF